MILSRWQFLRTICFVYCNCIVSILCRIFKCYMFYGFDLEEQLQKWSWVSHYLLCGNIIIIFSLGQLSLIIWKLIGVQVTRYFNRLSVIDLFYYDEAMDKNVSYSLVLNKTVIVNKQCHTRTLLHYLHCIMNPLLVATNTVDIVHVSPIYWL